MMLHRCPQVRVADNEAYNWLWNKGPISWLGKVELRFQEIGFWELKPATTLKHWDVLATWTRQIACRRMIPPLIVNRTEDGSFYIQDGNHRYEALRICYRKQFKRLRLRVAILEPLARYRFVYQEFGSYGTYVLAADRQGPGPESLTEPVASLGTGPVLDLLCEMRTRLQLKD